MSQPATKIVRPIVKVLLPIVLILVLVALGFRVSWERCSQCGLQRYMRSIWGVHIAPMSEEAYDEYGTHAEWVRTHGRGCDHEWVKLND